MKNSLLEYYENLCDSWKSAHRLCYELGLLENQPRYLYQYRSFQNFWKIIESDELWLFNIRFSNDISEQELGEKFLKRAKFKVNDAVNRGDYYMTCFSESEDSYVQWLGYANNGGVSIGFDFNDIETYQIISDNYDNILKSELKLNSLDDYDALEKLEINCILQQALDVVTRPIKVTYQDFDKRRSMIWKKVYNVWNNEYSGNIEKSDALIPFIKDEGFCLEREWRIIVSSSNNEMFLQNETVNERRLRKAASKNLEGYIRYSQTDEQFVWRKPYIVIRPGFKEFIKRVPSIKIQMSGHTGSRWAEKFSRMLKNWTKQYSWLIYVDIVCCWENLDKSKCIGCTQRQNKVKEKSGELNKASCSGNMCNYGENPHITISQGAPKLQERLFQLVHNAIDTDIEYNKDLNNLSEAEREEKRIRVWCEGHLPIRSITIGFCPNKKEMADSIRMFCEHSSKYFWLRDVIVKESKLPYRSPIK